MRGWCPLSSSCARRAVACAQHKLCRRSRAGLWRAGGLRSTRLDRRARAHASRPRSGRTLYGHVTHACKPRARTAQPHSARKPCFRGVHNRHARSQRPRPKKQCAATENGAHATARSAPSRPRKHGAHTRGCALPRVPCAPRLCARAASARRVAARISTCAIHGTGRFHRACRHAS